MLYLFGFFCLGTVICQLLVVLLTPALGADSRNLMLVTSVMQNVIAFGLPAWGVMRLTFAHPLDELGLYGKVRLLAFAGVIAGWLIGSAALNQIIDWNANMHLPEALSGLEARWRAMEDSAVKYTDILLSDSSWWGLISGIITIGFITGFGEEMLFRGGFMGIMLKHNVPHHVTIWVTAAVFSFFHFQMFGFVPRLLLGAWFGYLYWWSGSLWIPIFAHAFNNSLIVVVKWLELRGVSDFNIDRIGVETNGFPWPMVVSCVLFSLFIYYCRGWFEPEKNKSLKN